MLKQLLINIFRGNTSNRWIQLIRYGIAGGTAFIVDFSTLNLLYRLADWNYQLAAVCGFLLGLVITYLLSTFWVFNERRLNDRKAEMTVFTLIGLSGLALNAIFLWVFKEKMGLDIAIAKIITAALVTIWNFFAKKYILFTKSK